MSMQNSRQISDVKVLLKSGRDGVGIASIEKTGTSGNVDTYTITLADGRKSTFTVTNGNGIVSITKTGTVGLVDTYRILFTDGTHFDYTVTNGSSGSSTASGVSFDNTGTDLNSTNVQNAIVEVNGKIPNEVWTPAVACLVGDTTCTITNSAISTASTCVIEDFSENASGTKIAVTQIVVTSGQAVLHFDALTEATSFRLHIYNL